METFSGANFCFWVSVLVFCFLVVFSHRFLLYVLAVRSRNCLKNSLGVRSCFFGFVLSSLGFSSTSVLFFSVFSFKRERSGSNRTPPHALVLFVPVLFLPRCAWLIARFGHASCFLAFFSGCHSGAQALRVFGILLELTGLELARPEGTSSNLTCL